MKEHTSRERKGHKPVELTVGREHMRAKPVRQLNRKQRRKSYGIAQEV